MTAIEAVYRAGAFYPIEPVALEDNRHVRLNVSPAESFDTVADWLAEAQKFREGLGRLLPDCSPEIAGDRRRDR